MPKKDPRIPFAIECNFLTVETNLSNYLVLHLIICQTDKEKHQSKAKVNNLDKNVLKLGEQ